MCNFVLWFCVIMAFLCTIDLSYLSTFYSLETGPQLTTNIYKKMTEDSIKFQWVFGVRASYISHIRDDAKMFVANNIDRWREEKPDWFDVQLVPDEFLPASVLSAEGGLSRRRRSSVSLRELVGGNASK